MSLENKVNALYQYIKDMHDKPYPECGSDLPRTVEEMNNICGTCPEMHICKRLIRERDAFEKLEKSFEVE